MSCGLAIETAGCQAWQAAFASKRNDLQAAVTKASEKNKALFKTGLSLHSPASFESFEVSLEQVCIRYQANRTTELVRRLIYPSLDHLRKFSQAIGAAAQPVDITSICWGGFLAVVICICQYSENMDRIVEQLDELHKMFNVFEKYSEIYPDDLRVRWALRDLFEDYIEFCIVIMKHFQQQSYITLMRGMWSSRLNQDLLSIRSRVNGHILEFERKVALVARARQEEHAHQQRQIAIENRQLSGIRYSDKTSRRMETLKPPRNKKFIGRKGELQVMRERLIEDHKSREPPLCLIHGIAGVGKTETAVEFAYANQEVYDAIFWVAAETEASTREAFGSIGRAANLFPTEVPGLREFEAVHDWLCSTERRWLLIFDNVDIYKHIDKYRPRSCCNSSAIVVTSQLRGKWSDFEISLTQFDNETGSRLLLKELGLDHVGSDNPDRKIAVRISEQLGGLPIWISQICGLIELTPLSLQECAEMQSRSSAFLLSQHESEHSGCNNWRYGRTVSAIFDKRLNALSDDAKSLLFMLAFLNATRVNESVLRRFHASESLSFLSPSRDIAYLSMVCSLSKGRFIDRHALQSTGSGSDAEPSLSMHRSVQEGLLQKLNRCQDWRNQTFERVLALLRENIPPSSQLDQAEPSKWPLISRTLPHVEAVIAAFDRAEPPLSPTVDLAGILADAGGINTWDRGMFRTSHKLLARCDKLLNEAKVSFYFPLRPKIYVALGLTLDEFGISYRSRAMLARQKALHIRETLFPMLENPGFVEEVLLFNCYTDLICSLLQEYRIETARDLCDKVLLQYSRWGTESDVPFEYAKYHNHMGFVYAFYSGTEPDKRVTARACASRGAELAFRGQPGAQVGWLFRADLSTVTFVTGDQKEAIRIQRRVYDYRKQECGERSLPAITSCLQIGIMCHLIKDYGAASTWLRKAIEDGRQASWSCEHEARAKYYLSKNIKALHGPPNEAESLLNEARDLLQALLKDANSEIRESFADDEALLFDYIVTYRIRLITPHLHKIPRSIILGSRYGSMDLEAEVSW